MRESESLENKVGRAIKPGRANAKQPRRRAVDGATDIARPLRADRTACDYVPTSSPSSLVPRSCATCIRGCGRAAPHRAALHRIASCCTALSCELHHVHTHTHTHVANPSIIRKSAATTWPLVGISAAYSGDVDRHGGPLSPGNSFRVGQGTRARARARDVPVLRFRDGEAHRVRAR